MMVKDGIEISAYGEDFENVKKVQLYFAESGDNQCKIVVVDMDNPAMALTGVLQLVDTVEQLHTFFDITIPVSSKDELEYILGEFMVSERLPDTEESMLSLVKQYSVAYEQRYRQSTVDVEANFDITKCMNPPCVHDSRE